jgi:hypothetical protein
LQTTRRSQALGNLEWRPLVRVHPTPPLKRAVNLLQLFPSSTCAVSTVFVRSFLQTSFQRSSARLFSSFSVRRRVPRASQTPSHFPWLLTGGEYIFGLCLCFQASMYPSPNLTVEFVPVGCEEVASVFDNMDSPALWWDVSAEPSVVDPSDAIIPSGGVQCPSLIAPPRCAVIQLGKPSGSRRCELVSAMVDRFSFGCEQLLYSM